MAITLLEVRNKSDALMVPMNEVRSGAWSSTLQFLATEGLNSCTAVAIVSRNGSVLAHIAPRTESVPGDDNVRVLMQSVIQHYNSRKQAGLSPDSTTSIVLTAVYGGNIALPNQINTIRLVLDRLGLPIVFQQYRVHEIGEHRREGETSIIVHGRHGRDPRIYVNDRLFVSKTTNQ
ncbi:hypothetical protein CB0940_09031 [Cercospora beticola]|uniref:Uncharacterized protein n=1 Tax=Cercospora beticola TaxID=122368 RepID=A0A2G5HHR9_CERBT|nr:hypothetical protein CB0940_09031 [Cercospora beticola]PIA92090.1 hypothetical protein CB0940_09031 [Cercospora beticola]WPB06694.1 hypothetical protein RHO25_011353 [Cercospora beticola]CAK1366609.1 unnamed protein product [Cercospora beticola]